MIDNPDQRSGYLLCKWLAGRQPGTERVDRGATKSFYNNFPAAVAEASKIEKGEDLEWVIEDKNTFILQRVKKIPQDKANWK